MIPSKAPNVGDLTRLQETPMSNSVNTSHSFTYSGIAEQVGIGVFVGVCVKVGVFVGVVDGVVVGVGVDEEVGVEVGVGQTWDVGEFSRVIPTNGRV